MPQIDHSLRGEPRSAGVLLHPTSLPGRYGIGTFGPEAEAFLDFLARARMRLWQVLPLGPTGYGDSPYQGFSAFAGNPLLVALEPLVAAGYLTAADLADRPGADPVAGATAGVDFGALIPWKSRVLRLAFNRFMRGTRGTGRQPLATFRSENASWVEDFARFMALKEAHGGAPWSGWPRAFADRDERAVRAFAAEHTGEIDFHIFVQWIFASQWNALHRLAAERGISIIGDIPIFVSRDSADVWANRPQFQLDSDGRPTVVAGVPPDYFAETGQLWGNPIYNWQVQERNGFRWWQDVLESRFRRFDFVRVDHFRGFCAYWAVPFSEPTAENGEWVPAPGAHLFQTLAARIGRLPIIAEDLGVITPDVVELKNRFGFPGMKILQFGFDSAETNNHLPYTYDDNCVVYTGTHDNDTVVGWLATATERDREFAMRYLASDGSEPHWDFIRAALASTARFAVAPMQDLLGLGSEARMNRPGTPGGNWQWRLSTLDGLEPIAARLADLCKLYGRVP